MTGDAAIHPAVAAVLAVTPIIDPVYGKTVTDFAGNLYDAEPIAVRQAAAVLRWLADSGQAVHLAARGMVGAAHYLRGMADEIEGTTDDQH